jgi:hypothetical protein
MTALTSAQLPACSGQGSHKAEHFKSLPGFLGSFSGEVMEM